MATRLPSPALERRIVLAISSAREEAKLSQRALSRLLKRKDHMYISKIERGEREVTLRELVEIAVALKKKPREFIDNLFS